MEKTKKKIILFYLYLPMFPLCLEMDTEITYPPHNARCIGNILMSQLHKLTRFREDVTYKH